jgi:hypothetical protein
LVLAWSASLSAQSVGFDPHDAQPQRPSVATHAGTVAPGWLEIEVGAEHDRHRDHSSSVLVPMLAKIGLAPRLQLEVQAPFVNAPANTGSGIGDLSVGVKWRLLEGAPLVARLAVLPSIKIPTGSIESGTGTGTTDVGMLFISSHTLGVVAMDLNFGYTRRSGDGTVVPRDATVWTASFGGPARGRLGWVAELYGYPPTSGVAGDRAIVAFLGGPTWVARRWLVLDAGLIVAIAGSQPNAAYAGVVYNVGQLWGHEAAPHASRHGDPGALRARGPDHSLRPCRSVCRSASSPT